MTPLIRRVVRFGNVGVAYRDLAIAERTLTDAGVSSLAIRPVTLTGGRPKGNAGPTARHATFSTIRRADVAAWILGVAEG